MTLVLTNANLIDCVRPGVLAGARVTIEGGRIVAVSDGSGPIAGGAQVIDLGGGYLLPGLWDVHVHLEWPRLPAATVAELTVQYAANATRGLVESGVTAIRTAGPFGPVPKNFAPQGANLRVSAPFLFDNPLIR